MYLCIYMLVFDYHVIWGLFDTLKVLMRYSFSFCWARLCNLIYSSLIYIILSNLLNSINLSFYRSAGWCPSG